MSDNLQSVIYILTIIVLLLLFRKAKEGEPYLLIKLFGYTFLGAFMLELGELKLPLGFVIFLLFFQKSQVNVEVKHTAASIGLVLFLLGVFVPHVERMIFERTHHIDLLENNFYDGSLVEEYEHLKAEFDMNRAYTELRGFDMTIDQDGNYENLSFGLTEDTHEGTINYTIDLADDRKTLEVSRYKLNEQEDYMDDYMFTDTELVFANLDLITDSMLDFEGDRFYQLTTDGQRVNYGVNENKTFQINTAGKFKVEDSQLPVNAIVVDACGSRELDEHRYPFKCRHDEQFLLDMLKAEKVE
ncbi:hypothetical protein ACOJQI_11240 [Bacillus salacetis]|uniref:hypothetical protein n=1 Tax=Bacillus salacetis TaxID=2315464 RepID=UPI003BA17E46